MRLATKLSLVLCSLALGAAACVLFPLSLTERKHLLEQVRASQSVEVGQLGHACADLFQRADGAPCSAALKTLLLLSDPGRVAYAVLLDSRGRVGLHSDFLHGDLSLKDAAPAAAELARAHQSPDPMIQRLEADGRRLELISAPILQLEAQGARRRLGTVAVAYDAAVVEGSVRRQQRESSARAARAALPGIALALLAAIGLGRALSRPIRTIGDGARLIGEGKLSTRIPEDRSDELGDLAREFNGMARRLAELDRLKESFLGQITHDLRNPVAGIMAHMDVLLMGTVGPLNEGQTRSVQIALQSCEALNVLIGNILDLTRLEAGEMAFKPEELDLAALTGSVIELLRPKAAAFGVALDAAVAPGARVRADEAALRRVLVNLVSNALHFTPQGGRVSVAHASDGAFDKVSVSDTGIGIPADKLGTLFQKFSQVAETKNKVRYVPGSGLGLVICKQIVEAHGGVITAGSVYGKGSTFSFTLPRGA